MLKKLNRFIFKVRNSKHITKLGYLGILGFMGFLGFVEEESFIFFIFFVFFNFFWFDKMNEIEEYNDERFLINKAKVNDILLKIFFVALFVLFVIFTRAEKFGIIDISMSILKYSVVGFFALILTLQPALLYYYDKVKR